MFDKLESHIKNLEHLAKDYSLEKSLTDCSYLLSDIQQNNYSFLVVGEFSTGKSTFINGLIGNSILPTGITPTTSTINVLKYGEPKAIVHYFDKSEPELLKISDLDQFIASKIKQMDSINYIDVFQQQDFLKDKITLIDTPGLNDINTLRSDITYLYVPRADVVFFLLDCRTPLRNSEFSYINDVLIKNSLERIIFIANFADEIDESELEFTIKKIENTLRHSLELSEIIVLPYSASEVIDANETNDLELLKISGFVELQKHIKHLCEEGTRYNEKLQRYEQRAALIEYELLESLAEKQYVNIQSIEKLKLEIERIDSWREEQNQILIKLKSYYEECLFDFEKMTLKSIDYFFTQLEEDTKEDINLFNGSNFKHFFEVALPAKINKQMKLWFEKYTPQIQILISKLEVSLNEILNTYLADNVFFKKSHVSNINKNDNVSINLEKKPDPIITSGLFVGGASALFMLIGGPILLPIITMAGLPFFQNKLVEHRLNSIKPEVIGKLDTQFFEVKGNFQNEVLDFLQKNCNNVYEESVRIWNEKIDQQYNVIQLRIQELNNNVSQTALENENIQNKIQMTLQLGSSNKE